MLEIAGKLVVGGTERVLRRAVDRALLGRPIHLFLNFARVSIMDATGVGELAASYVKARDVGCEMALIAPRKEIVTLLTLCGLGDFFPVFRSTVDALETTREWSTIRTGKRNLSRKRLPTHAGSKHLNKAEPVRSGTMDLVLIGRLNRSYFSSLFTLMLL